MHHTLQRQRQKASANSSTPVQQAANPAFVDNRPEVVAQRKLQAGLQQSPNVQSMAQLQAAANPKDATSPTAKGAESASGLPQQLKSGMESMSGMDMSDVKVHYNSDKPAQLQAHAFAQGSDIHLAAGQEKHLAHEAWHVVQQKQGRVQPTTQLKGKTPVNDDKGLEREADEMGAKALQMKPEAAEGELQAKGAGKGAVQRMFNGEEDKKEEKIEKKEEVKEERFEEPPQGAALMNAKEFEEVCLPFFGRYQTKLQGCDDCAREVDDWLRKHFFPKERRGAVHVAFNLEIEKTQCTWSHTAGTVMIDGVVYVIDPTIAQFGGPIRTFWGTVEQWQEEVTNLCNKIGRVSNVDGKALEKPLKKEEMDQEKDSHAKKQKENAPKPAPKKTLCEIL